MNRSDIWFRVLVGLLVSLVAGLVLSGCALVADVLFSQGFTNSNLALGNPSYAISHTVSANNYLIVRPQYTLSYDRDRAIANWASWELDPSWLGDLPRISFAPDPTLPDDWYQVRPGDYTGSGFDRGHLVPAADRNATPEDSEAVFLMTNIFPQAPDNNRGPWERLERYCRELANQGNGLHIMAGTVGLGGVGEQGRRTEIGGRIAVPEVVWKIVVVNDRPDLGIDGITTETRVIAVTMPNRQGIKEQEWRSFRTSVDEIEALTGYDFLAKLSPDIQTLIEARVDAQ
ncbi:nuclease [filamentous cyanobacterium CCP2]|nr:nuclease [filamentous cyanobacterium CCP2]